MPRSTMTNLIAFVSSKIGDASNAVFTTDQVQTALDATRLDVFDEALKPNIERSSTSILYIRHSSRYGWYEDDYILLNSNLSSITPDLAEVLRDDALWTFNSSPFPPVWVRYGKSYDVWRAAAELLEQMIILQSTSTYNFSANSHSFQRGQIQDNRWKLIDEYRKRQRVQMIAASRRDAASEAEARRVAEIGPVSAGVPFITGP